MAVFWDSGNPMDGDRPYLGWKVESPHRAHWQVNNQALDIYKG